MHHHMHQQAIPELLNRAIEAHLNDARPILVGSRPSTKALWISSTTGRPMTAKNLGALVSKLTLQTLQVGEPGAG